MFDVLLTIILWVVVLGVGFGLGWLGARLRTWWVHRDRVPLLKIDRTNRDIEPVWVRPDGDGKLHVSTEEGKAEVVTDAEAAHTWRGQGRAFLVDSETLQCFRHQGAQGAPSIAPPDTARSLVKRARGIAERNFRKGEPEGWEAVIEKNLGLIVLLILFFVAVVIPAALGAMFIINS